MIRADLEAPTPGTAPETRPDTSRLPLPPRASGKIRHRAADLTRAWRPGSRRRQGYRARAAGARRGRRGKRTVGAT